MKKILAIETSCDETAAAVIGATFNKQLAIDDIKLEILSNVVASQIDLHKKYGGVYPELASRAHAEKIIPVLQEALKNVKFPISNVKSISNDKAQISNNRGILNQIDAIAVTNGPGLIGSLAVGVAAAKTLAYVLDKPIIPVHHWEGHIYSNFVRECQNPNLSTSSRQVFQCQKESRSPMSERSASGSRMTDREGLPGFPSLVLTVSGGHTSLILMKGHGEYEILGQTLDDAAGEAFDKAAKMLGLPYPGGPAIAACAAKRKTKKKKRKTIERFTQGSNWIPGQARNDSGVGYKFPRPMIDSNDYNFSFSGLKTAVFYKIKELGELDDLKKQMIAAEFQNAVVETLITKTKRAANQYRPKSVCLVGGVAANKKLREEFKIMAGNLDWQPTIHIPSLDLTTDNAAMIGAAAAYQLFQNKVSKWYDVDAQANARLIQEV